MSADITTPPDILSPEHERDPWATYRVLLEDYPVLFHEPTKSWLISRHEDVAWLYKTNDVSSDNYAWQVEPVYGRTVVQMEGKEHRKHRALLNPLFHGAGLEDFIEKTVEVSRELALPLFERERERLSNGAASRGTIDLAGEFAHKLPITAIAEMLGLPKADRPTFERWYKAIMAFVMNFTGSQEVIDTGLRTRQEMTDYLLPLIHERREGTDSDFISRMAKADIDGERLTDAEMCSFVAFMLVAGANTVGRGIANMFMNLLEQREQLEAVASDRSLIPLAFAEMMRHSPPVHMNMREAVVDLEVQGQKIPAGSTLTLMIAAANRDPRKFSDPDRFDMSRPDNDVRRAFVASSDHVGFAKGRHFCAGAMVAKAQVEIASNLLLDHMKDLRLAEGFVPEPEGVYERAPEHLLVTYVEPCTTTSS